MAKLMALQMTSTPDVTQNLDFVEHKLAELIITEPTLVVLPECFACFGGGDKTQLHIAESLGDGPIQTRLMRMAKQYAVWLVAGSMPLKSTRSDKFTASCLLINDAGELVTEYQKIHLFDVQVADNTQTYCESRYTQGGNKIISVDTPFGRLGLAICYDVRFPGLFQAMSEHKALDVIALPAAFTQKTGQAHWQALLTARAVENQCYLVAAGQTGIHVNQRQTHGHSCIISPWGETLAEIPQSVGMIHAQLDPTILNRIRRDMPVYAHNKFRSYLV
ncbi:carbon-nitrogen hydrolase family protein [Paraglaciecola sp. L1A13]|uniref:carbon-nitrogen hydrolase family protein n=1 Tax=Paraglaciecola sp. L1A13 TaxID=2686359 RepID=UPI00131D2B1E|nr:carbon-nitrogen hydrolase family protein [Paraglaciecola sp. L1A13]